MDDHTGTAAADTVTTGTGANATIDVTDTGANAATGTIDVTDTATADEGARRISPDDLRRIEDNPYVERFDAESGRITYARGFHHALYERIHDEGMTYTDAYAALGFDLAVLGTNRALSAGRRTMEMARNNQLDRRRIRYDGSVPPDQMGQLAPDEELAYLRARNLYLEAVVRAQKKVPSASAARR